MRDFAEGMRLPPRTAWKALALAWKGYAGAVGLLGPRWSAMVHSSVCFAVGELAARWLLSR